jgi:AsmA family
VRPNSSKLLKNWPFLLSSLLNLKRIESLFLSILRIVSNCTFWRLPKVVKRIFQATLIVAGAIAGLVGLGLLAINLYVQSPGTQVRLRQIVSDNLGYPISVFRISFTPWNGFHLQEVSIQDPSVDYPILKAQDLWIQCNYLPLLRRKLIVRQVCLSGAEIRIPTVARLGADVETEDASAAHSAPQTDSSKEPKPPSEEVANVVRPEKILAAQNALPENFWVEIRKFKIRHSTIYFLGASGVPAATLRDVEGAVQSHKGAYIGKVRISSAAISGSINVDDISSPVKCCNGALDLDDITAQISGGDIHGSFHSDLTNSELPYRVHLQITGVHINEIVNRAGGILDRAHGTLQGSLQLAGCMRDPSLASGDGSLEIKTGYLDQHPMMKELGRWTQIDELQRLDLQEALSKFSVVGQDIKVDSLKLISKNCEVNLWGTVESSQKLDLNGRLTLSQFLSQKIPNELEKNFAKSKDGESRYLDFQVTGTVLKPQTDLFERIIGDKGKLLKKLFRIDRKEKRHDRLPDDAERIGARSNG